MGQAKSKVRAHSIEALFFGNDAACERWRAWARGHDRSADYDTASSGVRKSWFSGVKGFPYSHLKG